MTAPIPLDLLRPFALVYRSKSFSTAAETLSVPRSTVSRAIAALEEALGVPLFQRTTRRVTPTAEGNSLFARVEPGLSGLESALSGFSDRSDVPTGTLRVTSTSTWGRCCSPRRSRASPPAIRR